jgi:hypothetical protein
MRWAGHVTHMGEERKVYKVLVGRRPLGRLRNRLKDGIRIDLREIVWEVWIQLAQDRVRYWAVVNMVMNIQVLASTTMLVSQLVT